MIPRRAMTKSYYNEDQSYDNQLLRSLEDDNSISPKRYQTPNNQLTQASENLKQKLESFKSEMQNKISQSFMNSNNNNNLMPNFNPNNNSMAGMSLNLTDFENITPIRSFPNDWTQYEKKEDQQYIQFQQSQLQSNRPTFSSKVIEQDINNLKARLQYSEAEILALKSSEVKKSLEIKDLEMKVSVFEEEIEELEEEIAKRKKLIEKLREQVAQCRSEIEALNQQLARANEQIKQRDLLILELLRLLLERNPKLSESKIQEIEQIFGSQIAGLAADAVNKQANTENEVERLGKVAEEQKEEIQRFRDKAQKVYNITKQVNCGPELKLNDLWHIIKTQALRIEQMHAQITKSKQTTDDYQNFQIYYQ